MSEIVAHQFDDAHEQRESVTLGMWLFLATEVLFFGALFAGYTVYRLAYRDAFVTASHHLNETLGAINTAVLLTSSWMMALAVRAAAKGNRNSLSAFLVLTILLGLTFLGIKAVEYTQELHEGFVPAFRFTYAGNNARHVELFFLFYFILTGLHAVHMIIGIGVLSVLLIQSRRGKYSAANHNPVEIGGLYWHFVDVIWVFLFPILYLVR